MVQDPNFWRRFSVAVHNDDLTKEAAASRPDLKHSYVYPSTHSPCPSAPLSPTSQCHLSPAFPASPITSMRIMSGSMDVSSPALATLRREEVWQAEIEAEKAAAAESEREREASAEREKGTRNSEVTNIRRPSKLKKISLASKHPPSPPPHNTHPDLLFSLSQLRRPRKTPLTTTSHPLSPPPPFLPPPPLPPRISLPIRLVAFRPPPLRLQDLDHHHG